MSDADGSGHVGERSPPEAGDPGEGRFGVRNATQDLVDVEYVFEQDDEFLPRTVESGGVVVADGDYVGIARVEPRSWSIHTAERKHDIIRTYQSTLLATLDFPIQIVCYPTAFDISEHIEQLEDRAREMGNAADEHPLITYGRQLYPGWLTDFIEANDMRQREYYLVVRVDPESLTEFEGSQGIGDYVVERASAFEPVVRFFGGLRDDGSTEEARRDRCLRELDRRLGQIEGALQRLDVGVERLRDRDETLSVLYHYYNNYQPRRPTFEVGTRTVHDEDAPVGESDRPQDAVTGGLGGSES